MDTSWPVAVFWGMALLALAIGLAFILPPLFRARPRHSGADRRGINLAVCRDQMLELEADRRSGLLSADQFETAKQELEVRLAEDALAVADTAKPASGGGRALVYALGTLVPAATVGVYLLLGQPSAVIGVAQADPAMAGAQGGHDIMKMIQQVEEKTKANPNDGEAWAMLAKTYAAVEHWPEALRAYEQAIRLKPDAPSVMTGYAEALAVSNDRTLQGKPMELILAALEKDPDDIKGLELAGIANFQQRNYAQAAYYFKRLLQHLPPESPYAQGVAEAQQEAKRLSESGLTGMDNLGDQAAVGPSIQGKLDIAPTLKAKLADGDVVFLFARSSAGGPPVAAIRASATQFPLAFELNDSMAMNPDNKLSKFKEVTLLARVAKSGDVKGAAGDLEGSLAGVKVGATDVKLVIDSVRQ